MDLLDDLIQFTAGEAVYGTFSVDSTHHQSNWYVLIGYTGKGEARGQKAGRNDAPEGKRCVTNTCKHHVLISPDNCEMAVAAGRDPFFEPKQNYNGKGTDTCRDGQGWKAHPGRFYAVYRAGIEAAFSAVWCVRSVTPHIQERDLAIVSICCNIGA